MHNLILGAIWLLGAAGVWIWQAQGGGERLYIDLLGQTMSVAWLMLFLAGFNLVRWYAVRAVRAERRAQRVAEEERRRRTERREPSEGGREPDPTFAFTDEPPPFRPPPRDQPPSAN
jgi:hypothetical protein